MSLSETLVRLRKQKGWTQAHAAEQIDIQQSYLSKLENGHFVPSENVIEKLCKAYRVKPELFQDKPKKVSFKILKSIILPLVGIFFIISGSNGLMYSSTYYTYKTEPVSNTDETELFLNYHLSNEYLGERFISEKSGAKYHFTLIATRDIVRQENRIQIILGIGLILLSIGVNYRLLVGYFKDDNTEDD